MTNFFLPKPTLTTVPEDFLKKAAMVTPLASKVVSGVGRRSWLTGGLRIRKIGRKNAILGNLSRQQGKVR